MIESRRWHGATGSCRPLQACRVLSSLALGNFPHRNVCCLQCIDNREAFNVPCSKLVEPVQNNLSFLQNTPNSNRVAWFVEQDMPSC
jgi:hypothetical protein